VSTQSIFTSEDSNFLPKFFPGKQAFTYRCINRSLCKAIIIHIPLSQNYQDETSEFLDVSNIISLQIITRHSETCPQLNEEIK